MTAMTEANMFDLTSVGVEELRQSGQGKQSFGEMVADAAQSLAAEFALNSKDSTYSNLPHHLQTSIFTRDNANLFDQNDTTNATNSSHDKNSSQDVQQQGHHSNSPAHESQMWHNAHDSMSMMDIDWTIAGNQPMSATMPSLRHTDMSLNYMHPTPSMLFDGSSTAASFLNDSTPSTTEPIWQRRMHARNYNQQTQDYDNAVLSMLADTQSAMGFNAAHYSDKYSDIASTSGLDKTRRTSINFPSFAQDSSWNASIRMPDSQAHWNDAASTPMSNVSSRSFDGSHQLQHDSSGSLSRNGNCSSHTPESSLLNHRLSSFSNSLCASPIEPGSAKSAHASQWNSPKLDRGGEESSEEEMSKKGSKTRKREGNQVQNKSRRRSKTANSPRSLPVSLSKPDSRRSSNDDYSDAKAIGDNCDHISQSSCFSSMPKGVISKVMVSKGLGVDGAAIQTEMGEGGETRHLCPHSGCDKHFSTSGHARRHSRIHASLRPFVCPHQGCGATFTRRDNCTQHQRARHRCQLTAKRISDDSPVSQQTS